MPDAAFDMLEAADALADAGIAEPRAKAIASVVRDGLATKANLDNLEARMGARIAGLETRLIARMDGGLVALGTAIGALIVAAVIKFL